jgi:hypothetical protein
MLDTSTRKDFFYMNELCSIPPFQITCHFNFSKYNFFIMYLDINII